MDTLDTIPTALILLLRGYAALTPPRYLHFPPGLGFKTVHDFLFMNSHSIFQALHKFKIDIAQWGDGLICFESLAE